MKIKKLNARGFSHDVMFILFAFVFGISGVGYLVASNANEAVTACTLSQAHGVNFNGEPQGFKRGDSGATYIWHDSNGWHVRMTDKIGKDHVYQGTIGVSGAVYPKVTGVKLDNSPPYNVDHLSHTATQISYKFNTYNGIDGFDFYLGSCAPHNTKLTFDLKRDGSSDTSTIKAGVNKQHPGSNPFTLKSPPAPPNPPGGNTRKSSSGGTSPSGSGNGQPAGSKGGGNGSTSSSKGGSGNGQPAGSKGGGNGSTSSSKGNGKGKGSSSNHQHINYIKNSNRLKQAACIASHALSIIEHK